jgi:type II secretory pathway pseudopilin PulG
MRAKNGFTLIELVIYAGLFSLLLAAMVFLMRTANDTHARVRTALVLQSDLRFAIARMSSYIRAGDRITLPSSTSGTTLEISFASSTPALDPTRIMLSNGILTVTRGGGSSMAITNSTIDVTSITFNRTTTTPTAVRMTLTAKLRNGAGASGVPLTLTGAAMIRR